MPYCLPDSQVTISTIVSIHFIIYCLFLAFIISPTNVITHGGDTCQAVGTVNLAELLKNEPTVCRYALHLYNLK